MSAAVHLARHGARVVVVAAGHAAGHWVGGPIDVAAPAGAANALQGIALLRRGHDHPYRFLDSDVAPAIDAFLATVAEHGLPHRGSLTTEFGSLPTGLGGTRPISIVPDAQSAALAPWADDEVLVVIGPAGFKDLWPRAVANSLEREGVWEGRPRPARVIGRSVDLPGLAGRRNLNAVVLAALFDDPRWRSAALDAIAVAVEGATRGPARVAVPAVLGNADHAGAFRDAAERIGRPIIEMPLVPPSVPGMRLHGALRSKLRALGGTMLMGEPIARVETRGRRVTAVATPAAAREHLIHTGSVILATGGVAAGGIVGDPDGHLREAVLGLPAEGPPIDRWLAGDPLDPAALPIMSAGIRTDEALRPVDPARPDSPLFDNVRIVGGLLAGQHWLNERCGDGIALASAFRAAASISELAEGPTRSVGARSTGGPGPRSQNDLPLASGFSR